MIHYMKLNPEPFSKITSGVKTIELRLYDEKRKKVKPGDHIVFTNIQFPDQKITTTVESITVAPSFESLFQQIPLVNCGYGEKGISSNKHIDMEKYYSKEKQEKYQVVGIRFQLISVANV